MQQTVSTPEAFIWRALAHTAERQQTAATAIASNLHANGMLADERADQDLPRYRRSPRQ